MTDESLVTTARLLTLGGLALLSPLLVSGAWQWWRAHKSNTALAPLADPRGWVTHAPTSHVRTLSREERERFWREAFAREVAGQTVAAMLAGPGPDAEVFMPAERLRLRRVRAHWRRLPQEAR